MNLVAVDVFAGGGGLTVGLKRAGFSVSVAVEIEKQAASTYKANHPEVQMYRQDVRQLRGEHFLRHAPHGHVHLLTGCPPCQGFTSLTQKHKARDDDRNALVLEMGRLTREILPDAVLVENVPGLARDRKGRFAELVNTLGELGYQTVWDVLQVADFGIPQSRRRLVLTAGRGFTIPLPEPTHSKTGVGGLPKWRTLRDAISKVEHPHSLSEAREKGGPAAVDWNIVRDMRPITLKRLAAIRAGDDRTALPDDLRPACHRGVNKGFTNVYGRMSWDQTPVTITAGCLTASTGRFGHPDQDRTISLREAAAIQTFPPKYIIDAHDVTAATAIVGNALPCDFAAILATHCIGEIRKYLGEDPTAR